MSDKQKKITQSEEEYFKNIVREELMNEQFAGGFSGLKKALGFGDRAKDAINKEKTGTPGVGAGYLKGKEEDVEATLDADAQYVMSKLRKELEAKFKSINSNIEDLKSFLANQRKQDQDIHRNSDIDDALYNEIQKTKRALESISNAVNQVSRDVVAKDKENTDAINHLRAELERAKGKKLPSKGESGPTSRPAPTTAPKGRSGV